MDTIGDATDNTVSSNYSATTSLPYVADANPLLNSNTLDRILPRQVSTGVGRGTQRVTNTDGSYMTIGLVPGSKGEFGIAFFNSNGQMVSKNVGPTQYIYDVTTGKNVMQIGLLPDGTYGFASVAKGENVADGYS